MLNSSNRRKPRDRRKERSSGLYSERDSKTMDFSYSASRDYTNFGFGSYNIGGSQSYVTTEDIRKALDSAFQQRDVKAIRALSRHFYKVSGIYSRAANYLAYLPTYDYMLTPRITGTEIEEDSIVREIATQLTFLEKMKTKESLKQISLDVIVDGVSYIYFRRKGVQGVLQKLPIDWCRTRNVLDGFPVVEFNLEYFNSFMMEEEKVRKLNSFPPEVIYEYNLWQEDPTNKKGGSVRRMSSSVLGDSSGTWITLSPQNATAFYFSPNLQPILSNSFFAILDVMELKGIEKKKAENDLYNLVVQKFGFLDDGEPILELPDMEAFHQSAKKIFEHTSQTDLLTTLADIENINLNEAAAAPIDFTPWTKSIYSELGISSQLFSTEGNMALEKSVVIDEGLIFTLVEKYQSWLNAVLDNEFKTGERQMFDTSLWFPPISINNRLEMAQRYKDNATLGYSIILPALALGQSQLDTMSIPIFENSILGLSSIMEPLKSSHTTASGSGGESSGGRPPLEDSKKSEKTIQNNGG